MISTDKISKSIATAVAMLFLFSCSNNPREVHEITRVDDFPMEVQENLSLTYSDSANIRLRLSAPLAEYYPQLEVPVRKFPEGIDVRFFDRFGKVDSRLTANYAEEQIHNNLWLAKGNVVVVNSKGEQLNTEELYWDENEEKIYSDKFVKITTDKEIIHGEGFQADQNFENYVINKVTGTIAIEDEDNA